MKKKLSFLFALLLVSAMGWAADYCNTTITSVQGKNATVTMRLVSGTTYEFSITTEDNITSYNVGSNFYAEKDGVGGYHISEHLTQNGNTLSVQFASSVKPRIYANDLFINFAGGENRFQIPTDASWDACAGMSSDPIVTPDIDPEPAISYCRKETGHLGNAEFGDVNGRILLTLRKTSNSSVRVKIEPNNNGNDYFDLVHVELNGVAKELGTIGGPALTNIEFDYTSLASLDFSVNVLWHNHNWADVNGRWTTNAIAVTEAELCEETTELSIGSEYCCYYGNETKIGSRYATLTWETNEDGDVVITIGDGSGETNTAFRSNGLGNDLSGFTVLSGAGFATSEPASDYFNRVYGGDGSKTYILQKKGGVTLPSPAKIHFQGKAFEWKCTEETNAYTNPTFEYTYGKICSQLDAPTNVAIDGTNHITFDAVAGADSYIAYVSLNGVEKYTQTLSSGDELIYTPLVTGDYVVNVVAKGSGKTDSDPSTDYVWHLEAAPIVLGNSEYCEKNMSSGDTEAAFTWETDGSGNLVITISEVLDGTNDPAHFRAGAFKDGLKVGASKENASNYFNIPATIGNADHSQKTLTYTLKDPSNAPALGEKIYYNGVVEYRTSKNTDAWPTISFEYTYGTGCSGKSVSATVNNNTMGSAVVKVGEDEVTSVDEGTEVAFIATSADPALYRFVNWTKGGVEVSTSATYVATITEATNLVANFDYVRDVYCHYEVLATGGAAVGKKLYMTLGAIGGGQYQIRFDGSAEAPLLALNNANYKVNGVSTDIAYETDNMSGQDVPFTKQNGRWSFDASGYGSAKMEFSLAEGRTIDDIYVWENNIYFNTSYGELAYHDNNDRLGLFGMNAAHRHNIDWEETCSDAIAPVFDKAEAEVLNESSVRLTIQATDNWEGILTYTISRAGADDIVSNHASGEEFTQDVDGLTAGTEYTFTVTVSDGVNDASQNIVVTPIADNVKPVMREASLESKTWNSAIISVAATDNKGVTAYYVVEKAADYVATEGKITIEGLTAATAYTFTIKAKDAVGNLSDNSATVSFTTNTHLLSPTTAPETPSRVDNLVMSIYSDAYTPKATWSFLEGWGQSTSKEDITIADNKVMKFSNFNYLGWQTAAPYNVLTMEKLHLDIWVADDCQIGIVPIYGGAGLTTDDSHRAKPSLTGQQWNSIDLDLATDYAGLNLSSIFQFKFDQGTTTEFFIDNVYFYRTSELVDGEAPTNVSANLTFASMYSVKITVQAEDNSGAVYFKVMDGEDVLATAAVSSGVATSINIENLSPGSVYNFQVVAFDDAENAATPVPITATTKALPTAAPQPIQKAEYVLSVYSDAYSPAVASSFNKSNWGSAPVTPSDDYLLYSMSTNVIVWGNNDGNAGHGNIDGLSGYTYDTKTGLNVSNMTYIHFDVWCDASNQLNTVNINDVAVTIPTTRTVAGEWVAFDVDITGVALADRQNVRWLKFHPFTTCNVAIDNVYFYTIPEVTFDQATITQGDLDALNGAIADVTIERTLTANTYFKTICFPFSMSAEQIAATFGECEILMLSGGRMKSEQDIYIQYVPVHEIEAGKPYLMTIANTVTGLDFNGVLINSSTTNNEITIDLGGGKAIKMVGTFIKKSLTGADQYYLDSDGYLHSVKLYGEENAGAAVIIPAFRCYYEFVGFSNPAGVMARVVRATDVYTDVEDMTDTVIATKQLRDGQLFIIRDGKRYTTTGLRVD